MHHLFALVGRAVGVVGCFRGMRGVACHVLCGGGHLVHRSGHQLDLGQLLLHALVGADGDVGRVLRGVADLLHRRDHGGDHALQFGQEGVEARCDLPQFVLAIDLQAYGEVAFALGNIVEHADHLPQRAGDAVADQPDHQQPEAGNQQTHQGHAEGVLVRLCGEVGLQLLQFGEHRRGGQGDGQGPARRGAGDLEGVE